jgi:hypothetical protein
MQAAYICRQFAIPATLDGRHVALHAVESLGLQAKASVAAGALVGRASFANLGAVGPCENGGCSEFRSQGRLDRLVTIGHLDQLICGPSTPQSHEPLQQRAEPSGQRGNTRCEANISSRPVFHISP